MRFLITHTPASIKKTYWAPALLAKVREMMYRHKYYRDSKTVAKVGRQAVFMVDGRFLHGGLCDRLSGIVAAYIYCEENGMDFKINWTFPFHLDTFLQPASHNWLISPGEISYNPEEASPVFVNHNHNKDNQWRLLCRIGKPDKRQVHIYSPAHYDRGEFGKYFHELFRPSPALDEAIRKQLRAIGEEYISVSFRFLQLLGDFKDDGKHPTLDPDSQKQLIERSIDTIRRIHEENPDYKRILVTSDSKTMLEEAAKLPYVYIIPGEILHMSNTSGGEMTHMKTFLDFFMIANAKKVHFAMAPGIYWSTFAYTASKINDAPFQLVEIK